jgi:signal transduction histidine kinase
LALGLGILQWALGSELDGATGVLCATICATTVIGWRWTGGNRVVPHVLVAALAFTFTVAIALGAIAYVAWLGLVAVLAFMLLGRKAGVGWTLALLASLGVGMWFFSQPGAAEGLSPGSPLVRLVRAGSIMPSLALLGYLFEQQRQTDVMAVRHAMDARTRLLASVSHEMRTPLNGIIGTTQLMRLGASGELSEQLDTIQFSGETLLALINDLLDVARAEAGKMELNESAFELPPVVALSVELLRPRASAAGKTLRLHLPDGPVRVRGDSVRLRQVIGNLIANAIRHGGSNIDAWLSSARNVPGRLELLLAVEDDGPAIDPQVREALFQPFAQFNRQTSVGGSGLGLFISRTIARNLGGELQLAPTPMTRFEFTLSLPEVERIEVAPVLEETVTPLAGAVLVVDDNPINLKVARALVEKLGLVARLADEFDLAVGGLGGARV